MLEENGGHAGSSRDRELDMSADKNARDSEFGTVEEGSSARRDRETNSGSDDESEDESDDESEDESEDEEEIDERTGESSKLITGEDGLGSENQLNGHWNHGQHTNGTSKDVEHEEKNEDEPESDEEANESDDEISEDGSEDDDNNEDDDEEPVLKYERFSTTAHELLQKDSASALAVSAKYIGFGMHSGVVHIFDHEGTRVKSFRPHSASVLDMCFDSSSEFVSTASVDGQILIHSLHTTENYAFDMKRPMRTVALEPEFARRSGRAFVCAGMAGKLSLYEKGWLGHKETVIHSGTNEGPVWIVRWRGGLIAWANDMGVKIYDTVSQTRITFIDRPADSPRADLFRCNLYWEDDTTLLIAWADIIKVVKIRPRPRTTSTSAAAALVHAHGSLPPLVVEISAVLQVDCMIAGIVPHPMSDTILEGSSSISGLNSNTAFMVLAYIPPDTSFTNEAIEDRALQRRKAAERPELRIISREGEELSSDALTLNGYQNFGCNDYALQELSAVEGGASTSESGKYYAILSPKSIILAKPRDQKDHIDWLVERRRYEEALDAIEKKPIRGVNVSEIGQRYIEHLVGEGEYKKAAGLCPKVLAGDTKKWETWIFLFVRQKQLSTIIPYIPVQTPRLDHLVYEMVLAHFLTTDKQAFQQTIHDWPSDIYDVGTVIIAVRSELDQISNSHPDAIILMNCLADLYITNRQYGKALSYCLRLRRPNVLSLIGEHNLFADVRDQVLLLVEFDQELRQQRKEAGEKSQAIDLLVEHTHSIPVARVVEQLYGRRYFLYLYLRALFEKEPLAASLYADSQVELYAEYAKDRLLDFMRASSFYSLENAYRICKAEDLVPEMVFLLGRMGNNKEALILIIERIGDVHRAIDFAKEQNDDDLWEELLKYSETRPSFIRVLLENVGVEINPIRLIRRIRDGLEIPGLRAAVIKILQDFNLQISLLEGCQTILDSDIMETMDRWQKQQMKGFMGASDSNCAICNDPLYQATETRSLAVAFLCRHVVHLKCIRGGDAVNQQELRFDSRPSSKIARAAVIRGRVAMTCPVCHKLDEGHRRT